MAHFCEDGTKGKILSEIKEPLARIDQLEKLKTEWTILFHRTPCESSIDLVVFGMWYLGWKQTSVKMAIGSSNADTALT